MPLGTMNEKCPIKQGGSPGGSPSRRDEGSTRPLKSSVAPSRTFHLIPVISGRIEGGPSVKSTETSPPSTATIGEGVVMSSQGSGSGEGVTVRGDWADAVSTGSPGGSPSRRAAETTSR
jgi:hypothetical protein